MTKICSIEIPLPTSPTFADGSIVRQGVWCFYEDKDGERFTGIVVHNRLDRRLDFTWMDSDDNPAPFKIKGSDLTPYPKGTKFTLEQV